MEGADDDEGMDIWVAALDGEAMGGGECCGVVLTLDRCGAVLTLNRRIVRAEVAS